MMRATWFLMILVGGVLLTTAATPACAQTSAAYPEVATLEPFSAQANFMSLPGYLRWVTYREQQVWLTWAEATRIVLAQGGPVSPQAQRIARAQ